MPAYNTQTPPPALYPGDAAYAFQAETPAAGTAVLRVDISYAAAPSAVAVAIQSAADDADAAYFTEYTSTSTAGESVKLTNFRGRFVRVKLVSQTGGGAITVRLVR